MTLISLLALTSLVFGVPCIIAGIRYLKDGTHGGLMILFGVIMLYNGYTYYFL